jgi:hypothetical protein
MYMTEKVCQALKKASSCVFIFYCPRGFLHRCMVVDFSSAGLLVDFFLPQSGHTQTMVGIEATITPVGTIEGAQKTQLLHSLHGKTDPFAKTGSGQAQSSTRSFLV